MNNFKTRERKKLASSIGIRESIDAEEYDPLRGACYLMKFACAAGVQPCIRPSNCMYSDQTSSSSGIRSFARKLILPASSSCASINSSGSNLHACCWPLAESCGVNFVGLYMQQASASCMQQNIARTYFRPSLLRRVQGVTEEIGSF